MPKITYIDNDGTARTVEAVLGATVMETAINNDVPGILATCGGSCSCATCHVYVDEAWFGRLPPPALEESDMLDTAHDLKDNSRLSCQLKVTEELDGLKVTTPPRQILIIHCPLLTLRAALHYHWWTLGEFVMAYRVGWVGLAAVAALATHGWLAQPARAETAPRFAPEPFWPKPLPENWILGQVAGIATDRQDNVWIIHRPATLLDDEKGAQKNPPETACCKAAPPVLKFDRDGNLLASWGGADKGHPWIKNEHGIHVDRGGNVWVGGNNDGDQILQFTPDGKFLQQIGKDDGSKGSNSTTRLGRPAHMQTDDAAGEIYVADGYGNRRVIVFDMKTGDYKRHWGAGGIKTPHDDKLPAYSPTAAPSPSFHNPVHCVRLSNDGLVYVCDRTNDRIQVFRKDGIFVKEFRVEPQTLQNGSVWDLVLSEDAQQRYIFIADGANGQIVTIARESGETLTKWGRHGRQPGQFKWVHNIAIDSKGNLFTAEVGFGRRVQKFGRQE